MAGDGSGCDFGKVMLFRQRGLVIAYFREGPRPCRGPDCQLAAEGAVKAAIEISFRNHSKSAERSADCPHISRDQALQFQTAELRRALAGR